MFTSTVSVTISILHANGPKGNPCHKIHGHDLTVDVSTDYRKLDEWGWGPEFSTIKDVIKAYHRNDLGEAIQPPSLEVLAKTIYRQVWGVTGLQPNYVTLRETEINGNGIHYSEEQGGDSD